MSSNLTHDLELREISFYMSRNSVKKAQANVFILNEGAHTGLYRLKEIACDPFDGRVFIRMASGTRRWYLQKSIFGGARQLLHTLTSVYGRITGLQDLYEKAKAFEEGLIAIVSSAVSPESNSPVMLLAHKAQTDLWENVLETFPINGNTLAELAKVFDRETTVRTSNLRSRLSATSALVRNIKRRLQRQRKIRDGVFVDTSIILGFARRQYEEVEDDAYWPLHHFAAEVKECKNDAAALRDIYDQRNPAEMLFHAHQAISAMMMQPMFAYRAPLIERIEQLQMELDQGRENPHFANGTASAKLLEEINMLLRRLHSHVELEWTLYDLTEEYRTPKDHPVNRDWLTGTAAASIKSTSKEVLRNTRLDTELQGPIDLYCTALEGVARELRRLAKDKYLRPSKLKSVRQDLKRAIWMLTQAT